MHKISTSHTTECYLQLFQGTYADYLTLAFIGLSPENFENVSKMFINSTTDFLSLRKKVVSSAYGVYRNVLSNMLRPFIFLSL